MGKLAYDSVTGKPNRWFCCHGCGLKGPEINYATKLLTANVACFYL